MSDANSNENIVAPIEQVEPKESNLVPQKRVDEITAEKYALQEQLKQQTQMTAELMKQVTAQSQARQDAEPSVPEGVDPATAKYLAGLFAEQKKFVEETTTKMYWQTQHSLHQQQIEQKASQYPAEVRQEAANRLTGLKQRYPDATMEDALDLALASWVKKESARGQAVRFNAMPQAMSQQSGLPLPQVSTGLVPPSQMANWESLDNVTQNKLISEYEKKGGTLF